ncbi:MAG: hypothetical protein HY815_31820 [Candidatus Riflebacteria bacterium]|nr:hypothetical protein [Candidatus Riflebacteria bacterium]
MNDRWRWQTAAVLVASFLFDPMFFALAAPPADATSHVVVTVDGVGTTSTEALDAALQAAVRQVVGTYVDATTLVKNDKLVEDKVLSLSRGYVSSFDKLSEEATPTGQKITIRATVETDHLVEVLRETHLIEARLDGKALYADTVTREKLRKQATDLLARALAPVVSVWTATVIGSPRIDRESRELVVQLSVSVDREAYSAFSRNLVDVLARVGTKASEFTLQACPVMYWDPRARDFTQAVVRTDHGRAEDAAELEEAVVYEMAQDCAEHARDSSQTHYPWIEDSDLPEDQWEIWVHTNAVGVPSGTWGVFRVSADHKACVHAVSGSAGIRTRLKGQAGQTIAEDTFSLRELGSVRMPSSLADHAWTRLVGWRHRRRKNESISSAYGSFGFSDGHETSGDLLVAPYPRSNNRFATRLIIERRMKVPLDSLAAVTGTECEVLVEPPKGLDREACRLPAALLKRSAGPSTPSGAAPAAGAPTTVTSSFRLVLSAVYSTGGSTYAELKNPATGESMLKSVGEAIDGTDLEVEAFDPAEKWVQLRLRGGPSGSGPRLEPGQK